MELKAMTVLNIQQMGCYDNVLVYFKSEADKVIAELKKVCNDKDDWCLHTLKENRHHKYKRCLAVARRCHNESLWWYSKGYGFEKYDKFWEKWEKRWLELAEQFKEDK